MNLMKIGRILLITTLLGLIIPAASAQTVEIADASVDTGATTTIAIMAYNVTDLANFNITVTYDPAVVNVIAADNNAAFGVAVNNLENVATPVMGRPDVCCFQHSHWRRCALQARLHYHSRSMN